MFKPYLQNIINDIPFDNLPANWQGFDFVRFSKDKTLFDFQHKALKNALKFIVKNTKEMEQIFTSFIKVILTKI